MSTFDTVDQEAAYEARLTDVVAERVNFRAAHDVELDQLVEIEAALMLIRDYLLAPEGAWLDLYGKILNVDRDGMDDTDYEAALELRKQAMRSDGTVPAILDLADAISDAFETSPPPVEYQNGQLSYELTMQLGEAYHKLAQRLLTDARPAGRTGHVQVETTPSIGFRAGAANFGTGRFGTGFNLG